ncbi:MAG TPA: bifunctional aldolase/short-chain dehydrogenase, partial [Burkholderiales bacterium]|nr:bifunctional aldolase/short-chain dehydrogenase [Burkholderiales bacterium]
MSRIRSLWNDEVAQRFRGDLAQRVYSSRLLGGDPSLVLHGGGNTSVKIQQRNLVDEDEDILYVKGSGCDLASIDDGGFAPVRLAHLRKLLQLDSISDSQIVNEFATQLTRASAPTPSVEALLHALLPYKFVDHTHADAVLAVTNTADGERRVREIYGSDVVVIPYVMPGFDLARLCAKKFAAEAGPSTIGMVLLNHGIFSFGDTAPESYARMIDLVGRAEAYLKQHGAWDIAIAVQARPGNDARNELPVLRQALSRCAGFPVIVSSYRDDVSLAFARRDDGVSQRGPATPDHVLRTKRLPMLGRNVESYAAAYKQYFERNAPNAKEPKQMLDPAPRVILDPQLGMCCIGRTAKEAAIVRDLYAHTVEVILRAEALGGYRALPERDIFDVEYWDLEQAKLRKAGKPAVFAGEVALVTGAASGIGRACVEALLKRGAAVIGVDVNAGVKSGIGARSDYLGVQCDVTSEPDVIAALEAGVLAFGGLDMLILNAGIFPGGKAIESLGTEEWRRVMSVNLDANLTLMREGSALLKLAPRGGRIVIIGSKNVPAPGPGAAAYSASK